METTARTNSFNSDVLHNENHYKLSQEEIAKAVRRHQREHPTGRSMTAMTNPQKTTPRH